jgi:hypothetical protein
VMQWLTQRPLLPYGLNQMQSHRHFGHHHHHGASMSADCYGLK